MPPSPIANQKQKIPLWKRRSVLWGLAIIACGISFAGGWTTEKASLGIPSAPQPIRLGGYQFINPLLSCNFNALKIFPEDQSMVQTIQGVIAQHEQAGDVIKASAYYGNFLSGQWASVYPSETYYPSSITKIPIMMAYFELAQSSPSILDKTIVYPGGTDLNDSQETKPPVALIPGQSYTIEQLIEHMIFYSDNNAAALLYNAIDKNTLLEVYDDLQIPTDSNPSVNNFDFITPQQISMLFRTLYNATYLSHDSSEKALELLSQTSFTEGLVAGVPGGISVTHKFGIVGINQNGVETGRELHDCGIVYTPNNPYILCVMTRGSSSLASMEGTIADISRAVYNKVENINQ